MIGFKCKLKNRRITTVYDETENTYSFWFRILQEDKTVKKTEIKLSREAMLAVVDMFNMIENKRG